MLICNMQKEVTDSSLCSDKQYHQTARIKNGNKQPSKETFSRSGSLLTKSRKQKVLRIRRGIREGVYDCDRRFDIAMDRLLEVLLKIKQK